MDTDKWWSTWAPLWDRIEDRHFGTKATESLMRYIKSRVLVVGAGLGLIVRYLAKKNLDAVGLDINPEMVKTAKEKYNIDIVEGNAMDLPFGENLFRTVIISSGVVDYGADDTQINTMVQEAKRVCAGGGIIILAFYKLADDLEKIYRRIGVIDSPDIYHMDRIFIIDEVSARNPLMCIPHIRKWTGKSHIRILFEWMWIGLTLAIGPLITERDWMRDNIKFAEEIGLKKQDLLDCVPDELPYWTKSRIEKLLARIGVGYREIKEFDDCTVVVIEK
jgi:ubiquinone/menaquinone biosynthesis C-methylase UbiE